MLEGWKVNMDPWDLNPELELGGEGVAMVRHFLSGAVLAAAAPSGEFRG